MQKYQVRVQSILDSALSDANVPARLRSSMRYSTLAGGKRVRALLVYASGIAMGAPLARLDAIAAALECIHAYSLIHDDLPAMDDDDLRRGQATNHVKYDDATAILAGDALQTLAFELIASPDSQLSDLQARKIMLNMAQASGPAGMVGGQMLDILATEQRLSRTELENVHRCKTGALISSAVVCGALASDCATDQQVSALRQYADNIGLAFQVVDDVLDIESSTEQLGKPSGADVALGKSTYPALIGLAESKKLADNLYQQAVDCINTISDNSAPNKQDNLTASVNRFSMLYELAELIINRTH